MNPSVSSPLKQPKKPFVAPQISKMFMFLWALFNSRDAFIVFKTNSRGGHYIKLQFYIFEKSLGGEGGLQWVGLSIFFFEICFITCKVSILKFRWKLMIFQKWYKALRMNNLFFQTSFLLIKCAPSLFKIKKDPKIDD